ncbi:MAG: polysaccharide deacetylase family protein [Verrucomicrobia bacterium]|nr:polysaccharide deacetylase family protein [Verrucomicrobiota bacterium]
MNACPPEANWPQLYIHPTTFAATMRDLKAAHAVSLGLDDPLVPGFARPDGFVLTFDDGFVSALKHAGPVLAELGFRAINFLVADRLGMRNEWDLGVDYTMEPLMDRSQVREWLSLGHDIGGHTLTHPFLDQIPLDWAREEITAGKKKLEDMFGREVRHFAYPYGAFNAALVELVGEAGYATACTTGPGIAGPGSQRLLLPRTGVDDAYVANLSQGEPGATSLDRGPIGSSGVPVERT